MQAPAGPFPRADAAPTQPQGRSWKHCVASAHGRSTAGSENGRFWGGEAILRPFLHLQCQLGTVHSTVSYRKYGAKFQKYGKKRSYRTVPYYRTPYRTPYCNSPDYERRGGSCRYLPTVKTAVSDFERCLVFWHTMFCAVGMCFWHTMFCAVGTVLRNYSPHLIPANSNL
jgi:hypothetical protein